MTPTPSDRFERWTAAVAARPAPLFILAAVLLAVQIGPWWYASPDSAAYFSIARSVAHGEGLRSFGSPHIFFSPAYPLLLSPLFLISDRPFIAVGVLHWLLSMALLAGLYRWAKPLGSWSVLAVTILTLVHVQYGISYRRPLSETFFMTAMVWAVLALDRFRTTESRKERVLYGVVGTLLLTLTCLIRPNGLMLIPGLGLALLASWGWQDRRKFLAAAAATLIIGGIAAGVFFVVRKLDDRRAAEASAVTYWDYLVKLQDPTKPSMWARIPNGIYIQMCDFQRLLIPGMFKSRSSDGGIVNINTPIAALMTVIVALGWWGLVRRTNDVWAWSFPFFMALNVLWAADAGTRYSLPVLPVIWATVCVAITQYRPSLQRWLLALVALHAVVGLAHWSLKELPDAVKLNGDWDGVAALAANIDREHDTFASFKLSPEQVQLFRFQLNRDIKPIVPDQANPPTWIITLTAQDAPTPPGYSEGPSSPPYRLFRRN